MSSVIGIESISTDLTLNDTMSNTAIQGMTASDISATCPHCGSLRLTLQSDKKYYCLDCKKRMTASKVIYK
jgi:Zn finger protein HypA/HybF involved in hydrogenase expression